MLNKRAQMAAGMFEALEEHQGWLRGARSVVDPPWRPALELAWGDHTNQNKVLPRKRAIASSREVPTLDLRPLSSQDQHQQPDHPQDYNTTRSL